MPGRGKKSLQRTAQFHSRFSHWSADDLVTVGAVATLAGDARQSSSGLGTRHHVCPGDQNALPEGLIEFEIGRNASGEDIRREHLQRACDLLRDLGTAYDLGLAETALRETQRRA